jgi:hypothetical protein
MLIDIDDNGASSEHCRRSRRRVRRADAPGRAAALVVVVAAGLLAAAPATARVPSGGATVFVHSATSGELGGGRLTLRGVGGRVTWAHHSGRSGVLRTTRLHRMLFAPAKSAVTGALHVAGHRGGDEPIFRLSRPRYSAAHRTVSYRAKPLNSKPLPRRAARAAGAAGRFGAASLSMVGAPQLTDTPSLGVVIRPTYPCDPPNPQVPTCFGAIYARGFAAGTQFTVTGSLLDPSGQNETFLTTTYTVGTDGLLPKTNLNLPCNYTVEIFGVSGPLGGSYDPPEECAWPPPS